MIKKCFNYCRNTFLAIGISTVTLIFSIFFSCCNFKSSKLDNNISKYEIEIFSNEISKLGLENVDTLLDIGSSFGAHDAIIFKFFPNIQFVLLDIDLKYSKMNNSFLQQNGKKKYFKNNAQFILGQFDSIPILSNSHKTILCRKTVHEFVNQNKMIQEIRRVLTYDGTVIIEEAIPKKVDEIDPYCNMPYLSKSQLIELFSRNGFKILSQDSTTMKFRINKNNNSNLNILKFKKTDLH